MRRLQPIGRFRQGKAVLLAVVLGVGIVAVAAPSAGAGRCTGSDPATRSPGFARPV